MAEKEMTHEEAIQAMKDLDEELAKVRKQKEASAKAASEIKKLLKEAGDAEE